MNAAGVVSEVKQVPIAELVPWDRNPRSITNAALAALVRSLEADPSMMQARPVIALLDGRVIAGNQRLRAAAQLGWTTVPAVYVDLDEQRATTWALRDNNPYGDWEEESLATLLAELAADDEALLALTGFSDDDLQALLHAGDGDGITDRGTILELADVSIGDPTHRPEKGELWNVGPHVLVIAGVYDGWPAWAPLLQEGDLLVPYPTPTLPLTERADVNRLVLVQPDPWLAGHLLDKYAAVRGAETIARR